MTLPGEISPIVSTELGVGFWDCEKRELRCADGVVIVSPAPRCFFAASANEARTFFLARISRRQNLSRYYDITKDTGD